MFTSSRWRIQIAPSWSPFVAAALELRIAAGDTPTVATQRLAESAKDLGLVGRDPIFGWGLIRFQGLPSCG